MLLTFVRTSTMSTIYDLFTNVAGDTIFQVFYSFLDWGPDLALFLIFVQLLSLLCDLDLDLLSLFLIFLLLLSLLCDLDLDLLSIFLIFSITHVSPV
jgi:hypothetical protein